MKWEKRKIGELCEITSSKRIFYSEYVDSGVPFFRSKEIIECSQGQSISEPLFISEEKYCGIKSKFGVPSPGDMLLTSVGTIGIPYIVRENDRFYFKDGNLTWFRNYTDAILPKYLYFWIQSTEGQGILNNSTIGSSQKALTISSLKAIEIPCPPIETQHRIADILSAYDSLIENNQKQIKLLEEAAQRLYKEWFVDLRFPGYEHTKIIDGVPEGWKVLAIQDLCLKINAGGTPSRGNNAYYTETGYRWFKTKELLDCWLIDSEEHITEDGLNNSAAKLFPCNTIVMAIYASPTLGRLGIMRNEASTNQAALCMAVNPELCPWEWLYLKLYELRDDFNMVARGAGQQNISAEVVKKKEIVVPPNNILISFVQSVFPIFEEIFVLSDQILKLKQTRDRLLPRLMSGEMEV